MRGIDINTLLLPDTQSVRHNSKGSKPVLYICCSSAEDQAQDKEHQENKEQDLRNTSCTGSNATEAKDGCDDSHNQKNNRPA